MLLTGVAVANRFFRYFPRFALGFFLFLALPMLLKNNLALIVSVLEFNLTLYSKNDC